MTSLDSIKLTKAAIQSQLREDCGRSLNLIKGTHSRHDMTRQHAPKNILPEKLSNVY